MTTNKEEVILDVPVDILTMEEIVSDMGTYFETGQKMTLTSVNPQILLMAQKNADVKDYLVHSSHRFADGIGLIKLSKWTKGQLTQRIAGIDVMEEALAFADAHQKRIFLYGAKPEVVALAAENIQEKYPNLHLAGYVDGYTQRTGEEIVAQVNDTRADMVFVALGSPKQENWLSTHIEDMTATVYQTIGGSLDVMSGTVKRAPDLFIKTNLEWLYRSFSNPKRMNRIFQVPEFIVKALYWNISNRNK